MQTLVHTNMGFFVHHTDIAIVSKLCDQINACGGYDVLATIPDGVHVYDRVCEDLRAAAIQQGGDLRPVARNIVHVCSNIVKCISYPCTERQCIVIELLFLLSRGILELAGNPNDAVVFLEIHVLQWVLKQSSQYSLDLHVHDAVKLVYDVGDLLR